MIYFFKQFLMKNFDTKYDLHIDNDGINFRYAIKIQC